MPIRRVSCPWAPAGSRAVVIAILLGGVGAASAQPEEVGIELPPIPDALLAGERLPPTDGWGGRLLPVKAAPPAASNTHLEVGPLTLEVTPGVNLLVEIAIDHLNRLLTPFPHPQVRTVAEATTSVDGSAIYVATVSETPVTLFISDVSDPNQALSLTLAPRRIPPREIRLVLTDPLPSPTSPRTPTGPAGAAPDPVAGITEAMRALAREEIPMGYGLRPATRGETVTCAQLGLETRRGQVLEGGELWLVTALARNTTDAQLEIEERTCRADVTGETVAVAAWPRVWLAPGERVELYVAVRPRTPEQRHPERPSLRGPGAR
jgi:conjugal transfer pilus assembly protein TraK